MASLKKMLGGSSLLVGLTTQHLTQPWLAKLWKQSGCDFVYVEYEHGFFDEAQLAAFVLCCRSEGLPVVAKTPELSRGWVGKLLECGVIGIQLPWTETREQIERLISLVKFPPLGIRAGAPGYGNCDYNGEVDPGRFLEEANRETVILAHVETRRGVENVDEIASHPQVDVVFLGMFDLSISFGHPAEFRHPEVVTAAERVVAAAERHGKVAGMWVPDAASAAPWMASGVRLFETASEVDLIAQGSRRTVAEFRSLGGK